MATPQKRKRNTKPKPVRAKEPDKRDYRIPDRLWGLPKRVEDANKQRNNWNQSQLAAACGLAHSVISKLMNYQNIFGIRLQTIYALSDALDVPVPWLLGEAQPPIPRKGPSADDEPESGVVASRP